jgi:hypothetical protein
MMAITTRSSISVNPDLRRDIRAPPSEKPGTVPLIGTELTIDDDAGCGSPMHDRAADFRGGSPYNDEFVGRPDQ